MIYASLAVTLFDFFFFNVPATTEIYTLSLHDALPISRCRRRRGRSASGAATSARTRVESTRTSTARGRRRCSRSEEHTSELQSHSDLVCRLLLEKKKKIVHNKLVAFEYLKARANKLYV